jgi:hypothetical protein
MLAGPPDGIQQLDLSQDDQRFLTGLSLVGLIVQGNDALSDAVHDGELLGVNGLSDTVKTVEQIQ